MNRRLRATGSEASNAERALWGSLAIAQFDARAALGQGEAADVELVLSDLLADLMHWCDVHKFGNEGQAIAFDSALERAREYYLGEREGGPREID